MRQRHPVFRFLVCGLLSWVVLAGVQSNARAADEQVTTQDCHVVAYLYKEAICYKDFGEDEETLEIFRKNTKGTPEEIEAQVREGNVKRLRQYIWLAVLVEKYGKAAIKPTDVEIDTYYQMYKQSLALKNETHKKTANLIASLLEKYEYQPQDRYKLQQIMTAAGKSVAYYEQRQSKNDSLPNEYQRFVMNAQKRMAHARVQQWKINKALYNEYKGRLVKRENGLEPVDAYAALLRYMNMDANLKIVDPIYESVFDDIKKYVGAPVGVIPLDEEKKYEGYFSQPYWLLEKEMAESDFGKTEAKLLKVPYVKEKPKPAPAAAPDPHAPMPLERPQEDAAQKQKRNTMITDMNPATESKAQKDLTTQHPVPLSLEAMPVPVIDTGMEGSDLTAP